MLTEHSNRYQLVVFGRGERIAVTPRSEKLWYILGKAEKLSLAIGEAQGYLPSEITWGVRNVEDAKSILQAA